MRPGRRRAAGFTLIEVLLATMLLAAGMGLAFATLRAAGATAQRGEAIAARNERIRAVSEFLRRRISGAQGIVFDLDESSGASLRFGGAVQRMRFVADLPDYLGRGGPHLHELGVVRGAGGMALQVDFRMVMAGETIGEANARPPEPLADRLRSVEFAYRTLGKRGVPGPWLYEWAHPDALPLQVRVRIADAQGAWPDMVVALPLAATYGVAPEDPR
jgi:general secretion pathway protein J